MLYYLFERLSATFGWLVASLRLRSSGENFFPLNCVNIWPVLGERMYRQLQPNRTIFVEITLTVMYYFGRRVSVTNVRDRDDICRGNYVMRISLSLLTARLYSTLLFQLVALISFSKVSTQTRGDANRAFSLYQEQDDLTLCRERHSRLLAVEEIEKNRSIGGRAFN